MRIFLHGEFDRATRAALLHACTLSVGAATVVDLGNVTFMDCGGYSCLVEVNRLTVSRGQTFTVANVSGQPARLIGLIAGVDEAPWRSAREVTAVPAIPAD